MPTVQAGKKSMNLQRSSKGARRERKKAAVRGTGSQGTGFSFGGRHACLCREWHAAASLAHECTLLHLHNQMGFQILECVC